MREKHLFWKAGSLLIALVLVAPVVAIFYTAAGASGDVFLHLMSTVMSTYVWNTIIIAVGVMVCALLFGLPCAWLMAMCRLPSEKVLQWALVLPLAMPGYIVGYIFTDWFDYAGPIQVFLRHMTGWEGNTYWFPDIRSLGGASLILGLVLYPYVYLMCRAAFMEQSVSLLQSARLLKCSGWESFLRISLPIARPAIAVGVSLVAMEAVGDFGTVSYFAVNTLTTAIYDTWLGYSNINAAAKISAMMLIIIFLLLSAERYSRRKQKLFQAQFSSHEDIRYVLHGWRKWLALFWCWGLVLIAFILPVIQLCDYAWIYFSQSWTASFHRYVLNSLQVSVIAACIAVVLAVMVNFYVRLSGARIGVASMRAASLGYAVPGTVLAIGVMVPVLMMDHLVNDIAKWMSWSRPGLIFSGTVFALIMALLVRFTAVAIGSVENSLNKITPSLDMASRTMGYTPNQMLRWVHLPLIRRGCLIAGLLVFIESMKELNAALLLRPFNFETLATYVYNYASTEQLELAALPALILILVGLIPLILINRSLEYTH
ncbi:ABC transporter permease [Vibrio mangrovi]|uniref:Iron ABC transporter permease n=1 Tax=Vibrio mangrovi TaxID=474394 RepID=A0A1Y6IZ27_9VIBR|nr:iron ABC transporter permease [Vibrio mangrovi]MDW6003051.1 iron ABC transporter permease [Vibrio mangrovi]SMS01293.1 Sulfate transport system permease protein CysW [Vibrio mangrovi]